MESLEIEVKQYIADIDSIRTLIIELGAIYKGKVFETNIRYEDTDNTLHQNKSLLRLRKDDKTTLTFKSVPKDTITEEDKDFKIHRELEVDVSNFSTMNSILKAIGFHKEQIYEKWRETFKLGNTILCLDTMPFGVFLEIEDQKTDIKDLSNKIGLNWDKRILLTYIEIFNIISKNLNLSFSDITFENFKNINVDFSKLPPLFV